MDYFMMTINEDVWTVYLIEDDDGVIEDLSAAASTNFDSKELYFRKAYISLNIVLHELWHVYIGYCYIQYAPDMSAHDIEEISASMFADRAIKIIERAKDIEIKLKEMRDNENAQV